MQAQGARQDGWEGQAEAASLASSLPASLTSSGSVRKGASQSSLWDLAAARRRPVLLARVHLAPDRASAVPGPLSPAAASAFHCCAADGQAGGRAMRRVMPMLPRGCIALPNWHGSAARPAPALGSACPAGWPAHLLHDLVNQPAALLRYVFAEIDLRQASQSSSLGRAQTEGRQLGGAALAAEAPAAAWHALGARPPPS